MPFLIVTAVLLGTVLTSLLTGLNLAVPMIVMSSVWAAWDSQRIGLTYFRSWLSYGPVVLFVLVMLTWGVGFPYYLVIRERIVSGMAEPKPGQSVEQIRRLFLSPLR